MSILACMRTASATVAAYGAIGFMCFGTLLALCFESRLAYVVRAMLLVLNPFASALETATDTFLQDYRIARTHAVVSAALSTCLLLGAGLRIRRYHLRGE